MLVATAQMAMKWTVEENHRSILATIKYVAEAGAGMVLFPELVLTGFHRKIVEEANKLKNDQHWLKDIQLSCRENGLFAWVGMPTFDEGHMFNSYVLVGSDGVLSADIRKEGLTESEETVFTKGEGRTTIRVKGRNLTAVMCREVADLDQVSKQLSNCEINNIVWPGFLSHGVDEAVETPEGTTEQAGQIAEILGCEITQCNWANSLNKPEMVDLGGSVYQNKDGDVVWMCPQGTPGIGFIDWDTGDCRWDPTFF